MALFEKSTKKRIFLFLIADIVLIILSFYLAFLLRFDGNIPAQYFEGGLPGIIILGLIACLPIFYYSRLYSFSWAYVSTGELVSLAWAVTLSFLLLGASLFVLRDQGIFQGFPRSTLIISYFLVFIFSGASRFAKRIYLQTSHKPTKEKGGVLIAGAGDIGEQLLRNILNSKDNSYSPVGFVDDSPSKRGIAIHGFEVLGEINDIPRIVEEKEVKELIIALPSERSDIIKKAVELGRKAGLRKIRTIPPMSEILSGDVSVRNLREIEVKDLLGRKQIEVDTNAMENFIEGKRILITGGAGSIGSELSRQVARFKPSTLLILDQDETGVFNITEELKKKFYRLDIKPLIVDIRDRKKVNKVFDQFKPQVVFHAAAYKHVPLMEKHPDEAVKNNIFGTKIVAQAALDNKVEKFIFVSTDKAVNPTSVMGSTKRIGEMICQNFNQKNSTKFISVRFGNVLDSRGSVIPIFREQIRRGGPVEVTHPEMKRYFMVIPEACLLVMQAAEMGQGGEVFVLNMGEPIKIVDLAKEMIELYKLEIDKDISIVYIGTRPGEKLFEEILTSEEGTVATQNQNIFIARLSSTNEEILEQGLEEFKRIIGGLDTLPLNENLADGEVVNRNGILKVLKRLIPSYSSEILDN